MKFSYDWLQGYFKNKLPSPEKLAEILTMHSFEVERVEKKGDDWILDIDVLPNRAHDCLSHLGMAREIAATLNYELRITNYELKEDKIEKFIDFFSVKIEDKNLCSRYTALVMENIKVIPSPKWMRERLAVCGLRPINNIVDIANYVMLEYGQPLHAFDFDKVEGGIIVRRAKKGEKITTLDEEKYDLDENVLVIADNKEPIAIAGIKGGKKAEITEKTKTIILESANFNPLIARRGSRKLNLRTDASQRFEAGLDPNLASEAIERAAGLIVEITGGKIIQEMIDVYLKKVMPEKIKLETEKIKKLLGIEISIKEIKGILERLGFKFQISGSKFQVIVSTRRMDITLSEDLIEEIGRLYGYKKIPARLPAAALIPPEPNESLIYENKVKDILAGAGLNEVINFSFADKGLNKEHLIEIKNPVSQEEKYLRDTLISGLLKNVKENLKYFDEVKIFEIGKIYHKNPKSKIQNPKNYLERKMIAGALSYGQDLNNYNQLFYEAKGIIELLSNKLGIFNIDYEELKESGYALIFHPQKRAAIKADNETIGWLGEINQRILSDLEIKTPIAAFEIDFGTLIKLAPKIKIYQPLSKYPEIRRDLTILTPLSTKIGEVSKIIKNNSRWLKNIEFFDIYQEEKILPGKKNLSFHLSFQSSQKTLTDKEVNQIQEKIIQALENKGWEVRK